MALPPELNEYDAGLIYYLLAHLKTDSPELNEYPPKLLNNAMIDLRVWRYIAIEGSFSDRYFGPDAYSLLPAGERLLAELQEIVQ